MAQAEAKLILHRGARLVGSEELAAVPVPAPSRRWYPIAHHAVLDRVKGVLGEFGYAVRREQLALSRNDARFFGTLDLESTLAEGVTLAVGIRSSLDQSVHLGFCAGSRTTVCDNMLFSAELMVRRKHTARAEQRFQADIAEAVAKLKGFRERESLRIERMRSTEVGPVAAESYILRGYERGIVPARQLGGVIKEWRNPSFPEFEGRTFWTLLQAFTTALGDTIQGDPQKHALRTMRLSAMLAQDPSLN